MTAGERGVTELEPGLDEIRAAPSAMGTLELIVRRPAEDERELLEAGELDLREGLVGDRWLSGSGGGDSDLDSQLAVISARAVSLVAGGHDRQRWALAGDQLYIDLDLSHANLPTGTRLAIGDAVIEVTAEPHLGCGKFSRRFGVEALKLVNSEPGRALRLRGLHARVVAPGSVRRGDPVEVRR